MAMTFDPFTELDRLASSLLQSAASPRVMPVDLYRDHNRYVLTADLPGVDPGSVDIDVDGQLMPANGKVYNINGQLVSEDANSFQSLPSGIYIINGKKYIK